jgi:hypothetical protein
MDRDMTEGAYQNMQCESVPIDESQQADPTEMTIGRRSGPRLPVELLARFQVGECALDVLVEDISEGGARLRLKGGPPAGTRGFLIWEDTECACRVVWSGPGGFGVQFAEPEGVA